MSKIENTIFEVENGYKLGNGNAQSVQVYKTYLDAVVANKMEEKAYAEAADEASAQEKSPVDWE